MSSTPFGRPWIDALIRRPGSLLRSTLVRIAGLLPTDHEINGDHPVMTREIRNLRLAVHQSPVAILITDLDGTIEYANPALSTITGYEEHEVIGRTTALFESESTDPDAVREMWDTVRSGVPWRREWLCKTKRGDPYWEHIIVSPVMDEPGGIHHVLFIKKDITDRKTAEENVRMLNLDLERLVEERTQQLETFFNVSLDMLCIANLQGQFIKVNDAWERVLGHGKDELMSKPFYAFVHPDDVPITMRTMSTLELGIPVFEFVNRYRTGTGDYRNIEWRAIRHGEFIYAGARDVTDRTEAESILRQSRQEAEAANLAKSEFLSRMSHELRTPLNAILGFAQLLKMSDLTAQQAKGVGHILKSGNHLLGLINEVLDISKIEAGEISISLEPVALGPLVNELVEIIAHFANSRNVSMRVDFQNDALHVRADRQRLKQVLLNLISNAVKYNRQDGHVVIETGGGAPGMVRISVTDTGRGIDPELLPRLFTPFERIGAESTDAEGTGLGLAIVQKLMQVMNGRVGVASEIGKGSVFWIELPEDAGLVEHQPPHQEADHSPSEGSRRGTILYVEDNSSNIELMEQIVKTSRPTIQLINTMFGRQAVNMAVENQPDLIFLDLNLPDMHGSDVLRELMLNPATAGIPVIVISADAMPRQRKAMSAAGARHYLAKPLDVQQLLRQIDHFMPDMP